MPNSENLTRYIIPIALFLFVIVRKITRAKEFQKVTNGGAIFRIVVFSLVAIMMMWFALLNPITFLYDFIGMGIGVTLFYWAAKHSVFENREGVVFYRTNVWIELIVITLFLSRFVYRYLFLDTGIRKAYTVEETQEQLQSINDPFMSTAIFLVCFYYIANAIFLLKKISEVKRQNNPEQYWQQ